MKKVFKTVSIITVLAMLMVTLVGCGGGSGDSNDDGTGIGTHNWKLSHEENDGEMMDIYADLFAEKINEKSDGKITIEIFPVGTLGDTDDLFEVISSGTTEFGCSDPGWVMNMIPEVGVFSLHYFFPSDIADYDALVAEAADGNSEGFAYMDSKYEELGVVNLQWFVEGGNAWTADKAITSPADFSGVKFRTMASSIISDSYNAYGADAVTIPYTELYSALQLGTADGQVNPISGIYSSSLYEVQDYLMLAYPDSFIATFHANKAFWDGLTPEEQELILECAQEAYDEYLVMRDQIYADELAEMEEAGVTIVEFTDDMTAAFKAIAEQNRDVFTKTCDDAQDVMDMFMRDFDNMGF